MSYKRRPSWKIFTQKAKMNLDKELAKCETMKDLTAKNGLIHKLVGGIIEKLLEKEMKALL